MAYINYKKFKLNLQLHLYLIIENKILQMQYAMQYFLYFSFINFKYTIACAKFDFYNDSLSIVGSSIRSSISVDDSLKLSEIHR